MHTDAYFLILPLYIYNQSVVDVKACTRMCINGLLKLWHIIYASGQWVMNDPVAFFFEALIFAYIIGPLDPSIYLSLLHAILPASLIPLGIVLFSFVSLMIPIFIFINIYDGLVNNKISYPTLNDPETQKHKIFYAFLYVLQAAYDTFKALSKLLFLTLVGYDIHSWLGIALYTTAALFLLVANLRINLNRARKDFFDFDLSPIVLPYSMLRILSGIVGLYTLLNISILSLPLGINILICIIIIPFCIVTRAEKTKKDRQYSLSTLSVIIAYTVTIVTCIYVSHTQILFLLRILQPFYPLLLRYFSPISEKTSIYLQIVLQSWIGCGYFTINYHDVMLGASSLEEKIIHYVIDAKDEQDTEEALKNTAVNTHA